MCSSSQVFLPPSGQQYEISDGSQRAIVTEVGATLRSYRVGAADVIDGFGRDELAASGRGQVLAPWPNRLGDGRYTFEGQSAQAAINEIERSNAIHGLVRWLNWRPRFRSPTAVELGCVLPPQPGYPWRLGLRIEYRLVPHGLTVTTAATNLATTRAPFGIGFHPYLTAGTVTVDSARLVIPGQRRLVADERGLPTGDVAVEGTEFDFTGGREIGAIRLDSAYTDLARDDSGRALAHLEHPGHSRGVTLWLDRAFDYLMVFTGDTLQPAQRRRRSIALEPMTCPPDALRSGTDLVHLDPGGSWQGRWGLTVAPISPDQRP